MIVQFYSTDYYPIVFKFSLIILIIILLLWYEFYWEKLVHFEYTNKKADTFVTMLCRRYLRYIKPTTCTLSIDKSNHAALGRLLKTWSGCVVRNWMILIYCQIDGVWMENFVFASFAWSGLLNQTCLTFTCYSVETLLKRVRRSLPFLDCIHLL